MKKIFFSLIPLFCILLFSACQKDGRVTYQLGENEVCASFPSNVAKFSMVAADGNKIVLEMYRGNVKGAKSVPVTITDKTGGVFTPAANQFDFANGESRAYLAFSYPDINNFVAEVYTFDVNIADEAMVSPGCISSVTVTAQRK